jgi:hypothetical protein
MKQSSLRHRFAYATATLCTALCFTASAGAQPPDNGSNSKPDNIGTGAYPAMKEEAAALPAHVIYRPADLAALGTQKLGVVAWGNGGCSDDGASSRFHLLELASHGYLVIANGKVYSGPGAAERAEAAPAQPGQMVTRTTSTQLIEAIDWALAENSRADSPYFGRIDEDQIALSGFSCGGVQALRHAADPRVDTLVLMNTGIFNDGPSPLPEMDITKDALATIHTPTIYILGGETDIAYANGMDDFQRINHVPVAAANLPVGHGGTYHLENGGSAAQVAVNWLQWQLRGDAQARAWFVGDACKLCVDAEWTLDSKGLE